MSDEPQRAPKVPFGRWPANYKFAYILAWVGVGIGLCVLALGLLTEWGSRQDLFMGGMVGVVSAFIVAMAPRWALDGEEEAAKRRRAREARGGKGPRR